MDLAVAVVRLLLAGVFVVSAVAKLRDVDGSREAVRAFGVPTPLVGLTAAGLPFAELACAALLVAADPAATLGALASLALLGAFTVAVVVNLLRGRRPECHCFGSLGGGGGIGWATVARNVVLLALAGLSLVGAGALRPVPAVIAELEPRDLVLLAAFSVLGAVLVAVVLALRTLLTRYGTVLLRLESLEQAAGTGPTPIAPAFALPDLDGNVVTLDEALSGERPVLLVFISPTCSNCEALLPDVAQWQADAQHPLTIVVVSDGDVSTNREKLHAAQAESVTVLLQARREVSQAYGVEGTPAAVLVGVEGRLAGKPMHAVDGVRNLHDTVVGAMRNPTPAASAPLHDIGPRPLGPGDAVPTAVVVRTEGEVEQSLADAVGDEAVLVFWRTTCGFCAGIVDEVRALEGDVPVLLVTGSSVEEVRGSGLESPLLRDGAGALNSWLRVPGTPAAARFRGGVLDSELAVGGPEVLALLRDSVRQGVVVE